VEDSAFQSLKIHPLRYWVWILVLFTVVQVQMDCGCEKMRCGRVVKAKLKSVKNEKATIGRTEKERVVEGHPTTVSGVATEVSPSKHTFQLFAAI
jgi:hypothetical protein